MKIKEIDEDIKFLLYLGCSFGGGNKPTAQAVKQLIKIVEKQNKRIKTLETLLNIEVSDDIENDAGEAYEKIIDEEEINIEDIEPTEPSTEV